MICKAAAYGAGAVVIEGPGSRVMHAGLPL